MYHLFRDKQTKIFDKILYQKSTIEHKDVCALMSAHPFKLKFLILEFIKKRNLIILRNLINLISTICPIDWY